MYEGAELGAPNFNCFSKKVQNLKINKKPFLTIDVTTNFKAAVF